MLHGRVIVFVRVAGFERAQRYGDHFGAHRCAEAAHHELFDRAFAGLRRGAAHHRHGEHVEQHCKAGDPGKCKPLSSHDEFRVWSDQGRYLA